MPKVNVTLPLKNFDGTPILHQVRSLAGIGLCLACTMEVDKAMKLLTLRLACTHALTTQMSAVNRALSDDEKFARGALAHKIYNDDEPMLKSEEIATLKEAIKSAYGPLEVFVILSILTPGEEETKE